MQGPCSRNNHMVRIFNSYTQKSKLMNKEMQESIQCCLISLTLSRGLGFMEHILVVRSREGEDGWN
jgi:hypothetical protein